MKLLMHTCCAPCSVYCIDELRKENNVIVSGRALMQIYPKQVRS